MIVWTSSLWKMKIHMAKKWPEMVVEQSFRSNFHFETLFMLIFCHKSIIFCISFLETLQPVLPYYSAHIRTIKLIDCESLKNEPFCRRILTPSPDIDTRQFDRIFPHTKSFYLCWMFQGDFVINLLSSQISDYIFKYSIWKRISRFKSQKAWTETQFSKILREKNLGKVHIENLVPSL